MSIPREAQPKSETRQRVRHQIVQGDRTSRFELIDAEGNAPVALADDICNNYFFAESIANAVNTAQQHDQSLRAEANRLFDILKKWKDDHRNQIVDDETNLPTVMTRTPSGTVRFQFFVVPNEGQEASVGESLVSLDQQILQDATFQILRLDSVLM